MKKTLLCLACLLCVGKAYCIDSTAVAGTQNRILEELVEIRTIQDSTYRQRMRAFEAKEKANKEKMESSPSEYSVLTGIKDNTDSHFMIDSWDLYGVIALFISLVAAYYTIKQWRSQERTENNTREAEKHTKNAPLSAQKGTLEDLPRHFYRNLLCTCAMIFRYLHPSNGGSKNRKSYPSESNLLKLQTLPDDIFLPIDIDENSYKEMHELKLLFRNYNMEVQVASEHLSRQSLTDMSLEQDFDNLLFKPLYLTARAFEYEKKLCSGSMETLRRKAAYTIVKEHFDKLMKPYNMAVLMRPINNDYLKQLLVNASSHFDNLDKKGAITRSLKQLVHNHIILKKEDYIKQYRGEFVTGISADKRNFLVWFNSNYKIADPQAILTAEELYESLKPYLDYVSGEEWDFEKLFYYMLAVDIAIETDRIGMINY